jgi:hypothetical protein
MSPFKHPHSCWICGNEVDLKTCYTDENGAAVHENCFLVKLALAAESMRLIIRKPAIRILRTDGALQNRRSCTR